ncbi:MAG: hypothetical protein QOD60_164 [Solirubrobacterales bacterium]|jgi:H+/Cl- antiporter ClcA|nr:hypothetical protein [Solirubrobacterales bacterium]
MRLAASMAIGAVLGLILGLFVNAVIGISLAPEICLLLGALVGWVYRPTARL